MWNLKCTIIPVIIGATGKVTRSLRKNLEAVPGKHSIDSLQKTAILGTSHIIRKILQCEAWSLRGGDHYWFKRITKKNRPVTRDIIITIIIIIIFLHGLGRLTFSGIDALPSFPRTFTIFSFSRFVVEGMFRKSGVVHSFKMVDPLFCVWITRLVFLYKVFSFKLSISCLRLFPHPPIPTVSPSITFFRKPFLRKTWPVRLVFLLW